MLHISNRGDVHYVPDEPDGKWLHWPTLAAYVGPGFLVCIAYLDPGNLEADLQVRGSLRTGLVTRGWPCNAPELTMLLISMYESLASVTQ